MTTLFHYTVLYFQQHSRRGFDRVLDALEERHGFAAIHDAMIIGQRHIHHRADHHIAFARDRAVLNGVEAEDSALGRVHNGRGEQGTINAAIADGEGATLQFLRLEFVVTGALGKIADGNFNFSEAQALRVTQHGNDEALAAADGDADVIVIAIDNIRAAHFGVNLWNEFQRINGGLDEEGHDAKLHAVFFLERGLMFLAQGHDGGHVNLVDRGEQGRRLLRFYEVFGHGAAQGTHGNNFFLVVRRGLRNLTRNFRRLVLLPGVANHIFLKQPVAGAGGCDFLSLQFTGRQFTLRRRHDPRFSFSGRSLRAVAGRDLPGRRRRFGGSTLRNRFGTRRFFGGGFDWLQVTNDFTNGGGLALLFQHLGELPCHGRGKFDGGFFRFQRDDAFVFLDCRAFRLEPFADFDFGDRLTDGRNFQFDWHINDGPFISIFSKASASSFCCSWRWLLAEPVAGLAEAGR